MQIQFRSLHEVERQFSCRQSKIYADKAAGLFPAPVRISSRCVRWIGQELDEFAAARAAGATPEQLRDIVAQMMARRASWMPTIGAHAA